MVNSLSRRGVLLDTRDLGYTLNFADSCMYKMQELGKVSHERT